MKHTKHREPNSVQKVVFFCLFVLLLISISLGIRFVTLVRSSSFDGNHRYTIEIKKNEKEAKIISLDPTKKRMLVLFITSNDKLPKLDLALGLPIDTVVNHNTSLERSVISDLSNLLFNLHVNGYDMVRLIAASKTITDEDTVRLRFSYPLPQEEFEEKTVDLMTDSGIEEDNKTVSITNASEVSGIGSRFGSLLENIGGAVIAVNSAPQISKKTTLEYYGEPSYTVHKLEKLLKVTGKMKEERGLSDIEITLGSDQETE